MLGAQQKTPERRLFACLMAERVAVEPRFHFASENLKKSENNPIKTMGYVFLLFHGVSDGISQSCVFSVYFSV